MWIEILFGSWKFFGGLKCIYVSCRQREDEKYISVAVLRIRIHMFLGLLDPDPLVRGMHLDLDPAPDLDPDASIIKQK
jgi:hypothetical protein